jgi:small subunit ribosomal protein S9
LAVDIQHKSTGRRKTSMARVRLLPGAGAIVINRRPLDDYFPNNVLKMIIKQPLLSTETAEKFDIHVLVQGGGPSGQAGAIRHGIARALTEYNGELRKKLKKEGFLTRDPRMK